MIIVYYKYFSKKDKCVKEGQTIFYDRVKALAFMYKVNDNPLMFLEAYSCDDPWDNDWLNERIHLAV